MWARLDDSLLDHPKILRAGATIPREGRAAAIGVYAVSLLWVARHLTDGFLPRSAVDGLFDRPRAAARLMLDAGLWTEVSEGFQIHDYADYNPSGAAVLDKRRAERDRKRAYRARQNGAA
jgi:hypothetical protein